MNEIISLIINIEVKAGRRQEQIDAFSAISSLVLEETGCLQYELKAVQGNENKFVILEKWSSKEALLTHEQQNFMIEADKKNVLFRAKGAEVIFLTSV